MLRDSVITIFGGSGFIGRYIVRELAKTGALIRVISRDPQDSNTQELKTSGYVGQIAIEYGDILKKDDIARAVEGSDIVINLVGILHERGRQKFAAIQSQGAERIAKAATAAGVKRLIQFSALGVDKAASSRYARTKLAGEDAVKAAFPNATIIRPSVVFGPEDDFFNRFAQIAMLSPALPLIGGGQTKFQPVFVDDIAKAVRIILEQQESAGKTYELGGPNVYSFRQLLDFVMNQTGHKRAYLSLPYALARVIGAFAAILPTPPITADQVQLLKYDNVVSKEANGFAALGIRPRSIEVEAPTYLFRYRRGGRFSQPRAI